MAAMASPLLRIPKLCAAAAPQVGAPPPRSPCALSSPINLAPSPDDLALAVVAISRGGRRQALLASAGALVALARSPEALADVVDDYQSDTKAVIAQVKETLALEKGDPAKPDAVSSLRQSCNSWVAKYRREKRVAGKPSFSNMYSVLNAISGHYISFGPSSAIPAKRQQRILEEVGDAEKALSRGR